MLRDLDLGVHALDDRRVDLIAPGPTTPFGVLQAAGAEECALHSTADPRVYGSVLWSMLHLFARWYPVRPRGLSNRVCAPPTQRYPTTH